jgi:hypothetical protein
VCGSCTFLRNPGRFPPSYMLMHIKMMTDSNQDSYVGLVVRSGFLFLQSVVLFGRESLPVCSQLRIGISISVCNNLYFSGQRFYNAALTLVIYFCAFLKRVFLSGLIITAYIYHCIFKFATFPLYLHSFCYPVPLIQGVL